MALFATSSPAFAALDLATAKEHLAVLHSDHDTMITNLVAYATDTISNEASIAITQHNRRLTLRQFPPYKIVLPRPPVQSITSVKYFDSTNTLQTWATDQWTSDLYADSPWVPSKLPTEICPVFGVVWPQVYERLDAVQVDYVVGYKAAADIPGRLLQAIKLVVGDYYEHREETVMGQAPQTLGAVMRLITDYRVHDPDIR